MTIKQTIIKAIKEMDISLLEVVLEDDRSYMDVSKETFIARLSKEFDHLRKDGLKGFSKTVEGTCGNCNKGCGGISFVTQDYQYMDVLFEGTEENVTDIYTCTEFITNEKVEKKHEIFFSFKEEEKVDYVDLPDIAAHRAKVKRVSEDFKQFRNNITDIKTIAHWYMGHKKVEEDLPFLGWIDYRFIGDFIEWFCDFRCLADMVNNKKEFQSRLEELRVAESKKEREVIKWLLKYDNDDYSGYSLNFTRIDANTNFLEWKLDKSVLIDYSGFETSMEYYDRFDDLMQSMMDKYTPLTKHFDKYGSVHGALYAFLEVHGVYLDLVEQYKKELSIKQSRNQEKLLNKKEELTYDFIKSVNNCTPLMELLNRIENKSLDMELLGEWLSIHEAYYDEVSTIKNLNLNSKHRKYGLIAPKPSDILIHHYRLLEEVYEFHTKEPYFKAEIEAFNALVGNSKDARPWYEKNKAYVKIPNTTSKINNNGEEELHLTDLMFETPKIVLNNSDFKYGLLVIGLIQMIQE